MNGPYSSTQRKQYKDSDILQCVYILPHLNCCSFLGTEYSSEQETPADATVQGWTTGQFLQLVSSLVGASAGQALPRLLCRQLLTALPFCRGCSLLLWIHLQLGQDHHDKHAKHCAHIDTVALFMVFCNVLVWHCLIMFPFM